MFLSDNYYGLNRTLCDTLAEMRRCYETRNFSHLLGLIEEAQTYANRMEAGLQDNRDLDALHERISKAKNELKQIREQLPKKEEE